MTELNEEKLEKVNGGQKITPRDLDRPVGSRLRKNADPMIQKNADSMIQKYKDEMME